MPLAKPWALEVGELSQLLEQAKAEDCKELRAAVKTPS